MSFPIKSCHTARNFVCVGPYHDRLLITDTRNSASEGFWRGLNDCALQLELFTLIPFVVPAAALLVALRVITRGYHGTFFNSKKK